ncbi:MAG TPA: adenylate/guanylate cyclase domain-containing protein [Anaerolineales bacterium]|nr:adenylate/guanylate cyclase domain-containing protein [Anaerolineales bacterium]
MPNLRTTVILKTDIVESTPKVAQLSQDEMGRQRRGHKQFISDIAIKNYGSVFQEEGDGYWIEFPSVTSAALAAIEMHQNLRIMQAGKSDKQRIAIRVAISVGDILHQETDLIGTLMSLTARIEKVTLPDEIYLSHAAWLILNKAEVQTSFVNEFHFKGFNEPERIYRVDQKFGIRVLADQFIVFADARGFGNFFRLNSKEIVENFLLAYDEVMSDVCAKYGGVIRQVNGDLYFMTFEEGNQTISAMETLCLNWNKITKQYHIGLAVGVHKGDLNMFRSYVFGEDINTATRLSDLGAFYKTQSDRISVVLSGKVKGSVQGSNWEKNFQEVDVRQITDKRLQAMVNEYGAYRFIPGSDSPDDKLAVH